MLRWVDRCLVSWMRTLTEEVVPRVFGMASEEDASDEGGLPYNFGEGDPG